jgi:hypothetical protein
MFPVSEADLELSYRPGASWESKCQIGGIVGFVSSYQFTLLGDKFIQCRAFFSFLDSLERVTAARYMPTDGELDICHNCPWSNMSDSFLLFLLILDDILRARLKTLGASVPSQFNSFNSITIF